MKPAIQFSRTSLLCLCVLLGGLVSHGAEGTRISAYPRAYLATTNDDLLINVWEGSSYRTHRIHPNDLLGIEAQVTGTNVYTNFVFFSTNIWSDVDLTVSNYFATNIFANSYLSNWFSTNSHTVDVSSNIYITNLFLGDPYVSNWFGTNSPGSYMSNFFATNTLTTFNISSNFYSKALLSRFFYANITNLFTERVLSVISPWPGPTNTADLGANDWFFTMSSDVAITNIYSYLSPTYAREPWILLLTNSTAVDYQAHIPETWWTDDGAHSYWVSNGSMGVLSMNHWAHTADSSNTAAVYRPFSRP